VSVVS